MKRINVFSKKITCRLLMFFIATSLVPLIMSVTYLKDSMEDQLYNYREKEIQHFTNHFLHNLNKYKEYMALIASDYTYWDDTYNAVEERDIEWLRENITEWLPENFNFSYVAILDDDDSLITENNDGFFRIHREELLSPSHLYSPDIVLVDDNLYLLLSHDISTSDGRTITNGSMVMAVALDEAFLYQNLQPVDVNLNLLYDGKLIVNDAELPLEILEEGPPFNKALQLGTSLYIFLPIYNNSSETIAYGILTLPYNFYIRALRTLRNSLRIVYLLSFFLLAVAIYLIKKKLFDPINHVQDVINRIRVLKKPLQLTINPKDDIGQLAHSFNELAGVIDQHNQYLSKLSITDSLTGLYNYRHFNTQIEAYINKKLPFTLAFIDISFIKSYSNMFTRTKTDELLKKIAAVFNNTFLQQQEIFIIGTSTFAIISKTTANGDMVNLIKEFQENISQLKFWGKNMLPTDLIRPSAGISEFPNEAASKDTIIKLTDDKLYKASNFIKHRIGNYYSVFQDQQQFNLSQDMDCIYSLTKVFLSILQAMDSYTLCHSEGVTKYSLMIGESLNLPIEDMEILKYSALLHDIGKIELGSGLLNKREALTIEDIKQIRMHTIFGENILCSIEGFSNLLPIIRSHHEWYNGEGYPDGLKGEEIPLMARIISVADAYDTMITNRPYRPTTKSSQEAIEELNRCSGWQFDSYIVDIFIKALNK